MIFGRGATAILLLKITFAQEYYTDYYDTDEDSYDAASYEDYDGYGESYSYYDTGSNENDYDDDSNSYDAGETSYEYAEADTSASAYDSFNAGDDAEDDTYTYGAAEATEEDEQGYEYYDMEFDSNEYDEYDVDLANTPEGEVRQMLDMLDDELDEEGEQVFYDLSMPSHISSVLGFEDNEGNPAKGVEPTNFTFVDGLDFELTMMRGIKRNKKKKQQGKEKRYPNGAISAFQMNKRYSRLGTHAQNCNRGWQQDSKICGNSCRVEFIRSGRGNNKDKLYGNVKYARCEACAIWAGFTKSANFFQKGLSGMRKGAPYWCDLEEDPSCRDKEEAYAACHGPTVCAAKCWSDTATDQSCRNCKSKWCSRHPKAHVHAKNFLVCHEFDNCYRQWNPTIWATASHTTKFEGRSCWGSPMWEPKQTITDKSEGFTTLKQCHNAERDGSYPYPVWKQYFKNCTTAVCDMQHELANPSRCEKLHCIKKCVNSNGVGEECLNCGNCRACPIKSLAKTGNFDRKRFGSQHPIVSAVGTYRLQRIP